MKAVQKLFYSITGRVTLALTMLVLTAGTPAQKGETIITGKINLNQDYLIYFAGEEGSGIGSKEIELNADGSFTWQEKTAAPCFISVGFLPKSRSRQMPAQFKLYVQPGKRFNLELSYSDKTYLGLVKSNLDAENLALFNYSLYVQKRSYDFWKNPPVPADLQTECRAYILKAEELMGAKGVKNALVKQYLKIWSYNSYLDAMESGTRAGGRSGAQKEAIKDRYPAGIRTIYDNELSLQFPASLSNMLDIANDFAGKETLSLGYPANQVAAVEKTYSNRKVKDELVSSILKRYIVGFKTTDASGFEKDVKKFTEIAGHVSDEKKRNELIADFSGLRYTLPGADMPDIVLKDTDKRDVRLHSFKGKYVYIDLWASWCVPCCKEVPSLQKLEQDYENKNIAFVSISLDANLDAWMAKMKELKMHGNQLETGGSGFEKLMNVTGIPRFLLYSPEGKLLQLNAPRPSSAQVRQMFDDLK